jgi:hypothetical protein
VPSAYPEPRTGTAQDLLRVVTRAYELELERSGTRLPGKSELARRWIEPPFRAFGIAAGLTLELVPPRAALAWHDWLFRSLAAPHLYPFDPADPRLARARALAARVRAETGKEPALMALISHPPVMGELGHLNFSLVRHASRALWCARGRPCRPRLVVAVDPFALDTASIVEEGIYAGYMSTYHLGLDRLALGRGHAGPSLTPQSSWAAMPLRLLRLLRVGGEVGLVLSGGVPSTGRVLYGAREWTRRARALSPLRARPEEAAAALRADASYERFARAAEATLRLPRRPWRLVEIWLMAAAADLLSGETLAEAAAAVLAALQVPERERPALLESLRREATRETPARRRLFRVLEGRVARRRPIVFLPVVHRTSPPGIALGEARSWETAGRGRVRVRRAEAPDQASESAPEEFAERFVEENFS